MEVTGKVGVTPVGRAAPRRVKTQAARSREFRGLPGLQGGVQLPTGGKFLGRR